MFYRTQIKKTISTQVGQYKKALTMDTINHNLIKAKYEVRGGIVLRAEEIKKEMEKGKRMPFEEFTYWNIGNPQNLGQLPISFTREVLGCLYSTKASDLYPKDVVTRVKTYSPELNDIKNYTYYKGLNVVRENVANFITQRDGMETNKEDIFLSNGASGGIKVVLQALLEDKKDTVLAPIPQYPLYSACIQLLGSTLAGYYLDEDKNWAVDIDNLSEVYKQYYDSGHIMKALVVINPGNPTGNILSVENIEHIIKFCYDHNLVILADEVYQNNVYSETKKFHSFKEIMGQVGYPYNQAILFSFHSVSKGYFGECGLRGGYTDMHNVPDKMKEAVLKLKSLEICPNVVGQIAMDVLINPPNKETCSESTVRIYNNEANKNFQDLKEKAQLIYTKLNTIKNFKCNEIEGAMYAFPSIYFPLQFIRLAQEKNIEPDFYYCLKLLEETGILTVAGSGFGQKEGTYHFRLTNLISPKEKMIETLNTIEDFNNKHF